MKLLIGFTFLLPFISFSQVTVTNADFADGGDQTVMTNATDPSIDFLTTGVAQSWDFSNLVFIDQITRDYETVSGGSALVQFMFGFLASSEYQATNSLPSTALPLDQVSGFLPITITDVNQFSKNSSDSITAVGMSVVVDGTEVPFKSDTIETKYKFPLNYGDSYSSRGYSKLDMNPIYDGVWIQYRQRESEVDGWGSITTPFGTYDALRIDHFITERDSLMFEFSGFPVAVELPIPDTHIYEWITTGQKEPVLRITTTDANGIETVSSIEYLDDLSNAGFSELENDVSIFPNPVNEIIHINGIKESDVKYSIVDMNGKSIKSGAFSNGENQLDVEHLMSGSYQLVIITQGSTQINSFVKN